jgi:hypothetical protein
MPDEDILAHSRLLGTQNVIITPATIKAAPTHTR